MTRQQDKLQIMHTLNIAQVKYAIQRSNS